MALDSITETIAHFVGLFDIAVEEARHRTAYVKFHASNREHDEPAAHSAAKVAIKAPYDFEEFSPFIPYAPAAPDLEKTHSAPPPAPDLDYDFTPWPFFFHHLSGPGQSAMAFPGPTGVHSGPTFHLDPPGSVAVIVSQHSVMHDEDVIGVGGHGLLFTPRMAQADALKPLVAAAEALAPLSDAVLPKSPEAMVDFVRAARSELTAYDAQGHDGAEIFVAKGPVLGGTVVDGVAGAEIPDFALWRPTQDDDTASDNPFADFSSSFRHGGDAAGGGESATGTGASGEGLFQPRSSMDLQAGDNTLVNSVTLSSNWLAARVTAVMGDHTELNAIVQVNAFADDDFVTERLGHAASDAATAAFNIATFTRIDPAASGDGGAHASGGFPTNWVVTEITGNLLIANWIEQINFMLDGDVASLAASGLRAEIVTGANGASNAVSLSEIGQFYDLIIVGGSVYDANLIYQMNVLFDDDLVGAVDGFGASGGSSLATHGNLLWNEAQIVNVGASDRFGALPEHYRDAAAKLAAGGGKAPAGLLGDEAFAGTGTLRALYISGDIINLQFIRQTNVLGDADKVALAMNAVQGRGDADWTVRTGGNTLVNGAGIVDLDAFGHTYVGGGTYSDEILIQAEFVSSSPGHAGAGANALVAGAGADALVNEAVVFLGDDMLAPDPGMGAAAHAGAIHAPLPAGSAQVDPMHGLAA